MVKYKSKKSNHKLVYSTKPEAHEEKTEKEEHTSDTGGTVYLRREVKGRGGKQVTTLTGLALSEKNLQNLAGELKRRCGTGGTCKDGIIIIQGDQRDKIAAYLMVKGFKVKMAGG